MTRQAPVDEHLSTLQSPENIKNDDIPHEVNSNSRVELLERNLRYIQQQHETILFDLHNEINRLQQENKDLHYRLINAQLLSSSEQEEQTTNQIAAPTSDKSVQENEHHFEEKIDELENQLHESEEKNKYLMHKIDELKQISSSKSETKSDIDRNQSSTHPDNNEYQQLLSELYEKQQQYLQEITKLRSVSLEILNTERLSLASKILLRDCLTSTNISQMSMSKTGSTPAEVLFTDDKQPRSNVSPSLTGKTTSFRHELPVRRLNISPPQISMQRYNNQQRFNLPTLLQRNHSTLSQHSTDVNGLLYNQMNSTDYSQYQRLLKVGETPVARRERRTQELQKNRLTKNLYH